MKTMKFSKQQIGNILENIYLLVFTIFFIYAFLGTTMFQIAWPENFNAMLRILLITMILLRMGYIERYTAKELVICFIICVCSGFVFIRTGFEEVINTAILMIGAKGISFKKIIKIYVITGVSLMLISVGAALTGHIENLIYTQEGRNIRIAFGSVYPTDFSAHIVFLVLGYCYLRREKISYIELAGIGGLGIFVYMFCEARLNCICLLLTMLVFGGYKLRYKFCVQNNKPDVISDTITMLISLVPIICASVMVLFSMFFSSDNKVMIFIDRVLSYRLRLGKKGIDLYGLPFLGHWIPMQGNGSTTEEQVHYFFLDSSYLYVLLQYGIVIFAIILCVILIINFRAKLAGEWVLILIIAIMAIQCMVEHHLMNMAYNPFLWALLADLKYQIQVDEKEKRGKIWIRKRV